MLRLARHRLPPLNTLRFFEAAARHGSFARAAAELCITAGAVSRQVKVLEESLGVALFHRHPQRLEITRTGEMLLRTVQDAINSIEQETRRIETDKNVVRIGLSPNFAVRWMSSRLHELKAEFPSLRLVIDASPELSDLSAGEVGCPAGKVRRHQQRGPTTLVMRRSRGAVTETRPSIREAESASIERQNSVIARSARRFSSVSIRRVSCSIELMASCTVRNRISPVRASQVAEDAYGTAQHRGSLQAP